MKALLFLFALLVGTIFAEPPPKPPIGVPADATFFNGKWYRVYLEKLPWNRAQERCKAMGGQLVTVPDAPTWEFVKGLSQGAGLWMGATDEVTTGVWRWVDGALVKYSVWSPGQPDNAGGKEHYAAMFKGAWADVPKSGTVGNIFQTQGFMCEWKK